ncbi:TF-B3 domain-containing protein [Psidium guajava]|nr:TF-B3 domain-containing protein [Psidium guajava]
MRRTLRLPPCSRTLNRSGPPGSLKAASTDHDSMYSERDSMEMIRTISRPFVAGVGHCLSPDGLAP